MIANKSDVLIPGASIEQNEFVDGLVYCHRQLTVNSVKTFEALAYIYTLSELLVGKGVVGIEELNQRKDAVASRLAESFRQEQIGVQLDSSGVDKYSIGEQEICIDCLERHPTCKAACCKLGFALSVQDVEEGAVRWDLRQPYVNRKGEDGYCVHLDRSTYKCTVYEKRPLICRCYTCQDDKRIWLDYEKRIFNPAMLEDDFVEALASESKSVSEQSDVQA